jgi:hypothetical protein
MRLGWLLTLWLPIVDSAMRPEWTAASGGMRGRWECEMREVILRCLGYVSIGIIFTAIQYFYTIPAVERCDVLLAL